MKAYFILQYKMTGRRLLDFGLKPLIGYTLLLAGFIALSIYLFQKTGFAEYFYLLISLSFVMQLSETKRNDFLKMCFSKKEYIKTRAIENMIVILPFIVFLIAKSLFFPAIILILIAGLLALLNFKTTYSLPVPTPFHKRPFEFTVGFRNTFYLFAFSYCLTVIAIAVHNFNLGIFSLLLVLLIISGYYTKPENEYFVWSYSLTPLRFLEEKIKTAILFSSLLGLPIIVALCIFFFDNILTLLLSMLFYYLYLITIILAKYSNYPEEMNLVQFFLIAVSLLFPPALIIIIPYFFNQSVNRLKSILA